MADAPIKSLLRSRKFLLAVFGLVQTVLSFYFEWPAEVWVSINGLIAVLIGSIAYEDGQEKNGAYAVESFREGARSHSSFSRQTEER